MDGDYANSIIDPTTLDFRNSGGPKVDALVKEVNNSARVSEAEGVGAQVEVPASASAQRTAVPNRLERG